MTCTLKHVKYEPTDEEWLCPKCGAEAGDFYIEARENENDSSPDCELLHEDDVLDCNGCGYSVSGKAFSALIVKKKNLVKCPCCKGKGYVTKDKV